MDIDRYRFYRAFYLRAARDDRGLRGAMLELRRAFYARAF